MSEFYENNIFKRDGVLYCINPSEASKRNGFITQENGFLKLAAIHM